MAVTKAQLDTLFSRIQQLEGRKKDVSGEISEAFKAFAEQYVDEGGNEKVFKKAVKSAYKKYKEAQKEKIYRAVIASGRSIEEILAAISDKKEEQE